MKKTRKLVLIAILMFVVAAATGGAYAYWAGTVSAPAPDTDSISITIGEADTVTTQLQVTDPAANTDTLVPAGQATHSVAPASGTNVEFMDFTYSVKWASLSGSAVGAVGTLNMKVTAKTIDSDATLGGKYVKVQVYDSGAGSYKDLAAAGEDYTITADDASATSVQIRVTLLEPEDAADYAAVATKAIALTVAFNVTP